MLIVKVLVNEHEIDEVYIWNTGRKVDQYDETYEYRILKPEGYEKISIYHNRDKGWKDLVRKVLDFLE
jgi:hypothetical protein